MNVFGPFFGYLLPLDVEKLCPMLKNYPRVKEGGGKAGVWEGDGYTPRIYVNLGLTHILPCPHQEGATILAPSLGGKYFSLTSYTAFLSWFGPLCWVLHHRRMYPSLIWTYLPNPSIYHIVCTDTELLQHGQPKYNKCI